MANKGFVPTFKDLYHAADGEQSNWKYGMFTDWCKDPWMALGSFFCMPCARGMLSEKTSTGDFLPSCLMNCFCPCFADCSHNIAARQQVRGEHGVEGTILEDFCLLSCRPCSAAQEFNQLGVTMDDVEKDVSR
ncbi:conserved hypothetical protein [Perkinsus marinus ATCC 50983]|uniref:Uncharacterized protein n=1 Tax=Perkinsus marinus (strain ATCC 50983 / TXsc) TaxID=423536 RepID=C5K596_PERM5|nr:conserved hypothetical protein [Perkinsus marinus ATCC 50983]EER20518.1 conserved hypothetical protein [Perkinsus marinus ATCC 50983]|eukprot:XP_002788722.1 conserved hypothetical protein [Perkinsus marinus ATCC 50983]